MATSFQSKFTRFILGFLALTGLPFLTRAELPAPETPHPGLHYYYEAEAPVENVTADVIVYGGTSGGVVAAVKAARMGKSVALVELGRYLGGLTSGGLTFTDGVDHNVQGGITAEFFQAVGRTKFRPSVAETQFGRMLADAGVPVYFEQRLDRENGVTIENNRITSITTENGSTFTGEMFIDATYEGDLMAAAGVTYTSGRDPVELYNEQGAGVQEGRNQRIDPYIVEGDPSSGLIPLVADMPESYTAEPGDGDNLLMSYTFRLHLTDEEDRVPYPKPEGYDPNRWELLYRFMKPGSTVRLALGSDTNNHEVIGHSMGTNYVNGNWILRDGEIINWAEATYQEREQMFQDQVDYQQGYFYYIAHDLLPAAQADPELQTAENEWAMEQIEKLATTVAQYGLDPNEFQTTGHWPHTLYVREARRMISEVVMTEHHHFRDEIVDDPVGLANYFADSHKVRRYLKDDKVFLEGDIPVERNFEPWGISYRSIIPAREEIQNLFVPWAISASKVAFCSMRMEKASGHPLGSKGQSCLTRRSKRFWAGSASRIFEAATSRRSPVTPL
jgi:hypothetical protein